MTATYPAPTATKTVTPPIQQTVIQQPVIERIRETVRTVTEPGADAAYVDARIAALTQSLQSQIAAARSESQTIYQTSAWPRASRDLDGVNITNATITGGAISGVSFAVEASGVSGTLTNAIESAIATITDLTSTTITATNDHVHQRDIHELCSNDCGYDRSSRQDRSRSDLRLASCEQVAASSRRSPTVWTARC